MRCLLLFALLVYSTFGQREFVNVVRNYDGPECAMVLDHRDYFTETMGKNKNGKPHYLWGITQNRGRLLYCARFTSKSKFRARVDYTLSIPGDDIKGDIISIQVIDRKTPQKAGYVYVSEGGTNSHFAALRFLSKEGRSMDYVLAIYGRPRGHH